MDSKRDEKILELVNILKKMNYDNFFLPAENFDESKRFFAEGLNLKIKFDFSEMGMIAFSVGDEEPAIILKDKTKFPNTKPTISIKENFKPKIATDNIAASTGSKAVKIPAREEEI